MDDGERPTLIHLDYGDDDLKKAFIEWDSIGELTSGVKTLYHAQIAPEARYQMTPDQWNRAAEILADELGMGDHPRAVVIHEGGDKPHAHVVFQRTNTDTMTLWDDGHNYAREELVAELGAAFLCADLGITPDIREDHAAYLGHWLSVLKEDKRAIFSAAAHAQRAADYLKGLQPDAVQVQEEEQESAAA